MAYFKRLLRSSQGKITTPLAVASLTDLIENHHDKEKIGVGIDYFFVAPSPAHHGKCFNIQRLDGSCTDFSYRKCISRPTSKTKVLRALRHTVDQCIRRKKLDLFMATQMTGGIVCPLTKRPLEWETCHADHQAPFTFEVICHFFLDKESFEWDTFPLSNGDNAFGSVEHSLADKFRTFHNKHAHMRLIAASENLRIAYTSRINSLRGPNLLFYDK